MTVDPIQIGLITLIIAAFAWGLTHRSKVKQIIANLEQRFGAPAAQAIAAGIPSTVVLPPAADSTETSLATAPIEPVVSAPAPATSVAPAPAIEAPAASVGNAGPAAPSDLAATTALENRLPPLTGEALYRIHVEAVRGGTDPTLEIQLGTTLHNQYRNAYGPGGYYRDMEMDLFAARAAGFSNPPAFVWASFVAKGWGQVTNGKFVWGDNMFGPFARYRGVSLGY